MTALIPAGNASGTGSLTLQAPNTNSNLTATLPAASGTMMVSGNMPAFSASTSSGISFSSNTWTKVPLQTIFFDTANCFDNVTNYRYTPNVAGYYQFNGYLSFASALAVLNCQFYKNGSSLGNPLQLGSASGGYINGLIYMNGTTDYIELWGLSGSTQNAGGTFSGLLVRAA